ncbi:MAG: hypothetical protein AVDCRST_MAG48-1399, partial [uncultured Friedmanniella sp.]
WRTPRSRTPRARTGGSGTWPGTACRPPPSPSAARSPSRWRSGCWCGGSD